MATSSLRSILVALVTIVAILAVAALLIFRSLARAPSDTVREGGEALATLARAFREGRVLTELHGFATRVSGTSRFQFATLETEEVFRRTDSTRVLWGRLPLPDVVVEARVPVATTYYLDLEEPWHLEIDGSMILVEVPPIRFNRPAVDASAFTIRVREGSLLRDEEAVRRNLQSALGELLRERARENVALVRETGRRRVEEFVRGWLLAEHPGSEGSRILVRFEDETGALEVLEAPGKLEASPD